MPVGIATPVQDTVGGPMRKTLVLTICCMSLFIVGLDNTVVNLALPAIQRELHSTVSGLQWTIDAYTLVLASLLMLAGSTADRVGRKRTFQLGLVLFSAGSLLCSVAPDTGSLIAFRMLQAIGGSMLNPVAMSIITNVFIEPRQRAQAIGVWGAVVGLSMALGPVVGGALVDSIGWRSIFWLNVPVGLAAVVLTALFVPESRAEHPRRLDPVGQALVMVVLATLTYGIIEGPSDGWGSPLIAGCFVASAVALVALIGYERHRREPLLDIRFFRSVPFTGATLTAVFGFSALAGFSFLNALYLQDARGFSPLHAGLLTLPMAAATALFSALAGRIVGRRGPRLPLVVAGAGITTAAALLATLRQDTPVWFLIVAYVVFGIGFGMVNPPITNAAVSGMPRAQAGVAAAIASTSRQVGASLGVAVLGSVVTGRIVGDFATGFAPASHLGWYIMAGSGVVVVFLAFVTTSGWARRTSAAIGRSA
ncbi:MAG TPA: MFS transporter [Pseudonocardiaceae bacterium]|nr:MFS transporter [Pseudonocardiaceae bacterium]